jgi:hypothetical protein
MSDRTDSFSAWLLGVFWFAIVGLIAVGLFKFIFR